jgi:hypothetical protein
VKYARVVFLKEVGAFKGRDGAVYGPYKPKDEAIIPEEDARELALKGLVATIGCYAVEGTLVDAERRVKPIERELTRDLELLELTSVVPVVAFLSLTPLFLLTPLALRHLDCVTLT